MNIKIKPSALRQTHFHEYAVRFIFGGIVTAVAGLVAKRWGAELAGLLLAFPAIFLASATLIEKHQIERKRKAHQHGTRRGREAAALDAAGAAMGCLGLVAFALVVWIWLPGHSSLLVLIAAGLLWLAVSLATWRIRRFL